MIESLTRKRVSIRQFKEREIPERILRTMLEAARRSPSGGNEQQYVFGVVRDKSVVRQIGECSYGQRWITTATLLVVLCTKIEDDSLGGRTIQVQRFPGYANEIEGMDKRLYSYLNLEEHQTKIPGTVMALAARARGIDSTWVSRFDVLRVKELLSLPDAVYPSEILAFGYRAKKATQPKKKGIEELAFYDRYCGRVHAPRRRSLWPIHH
jgi:nitroreductase